MKIYIKFKDETYFINTNKKVNKDILLLNELFPNITITYSLSNKINYYEELYKTTTLERES